jgi:hypothetical protein
MPQSIADPAVFARAASRETADRSTQYLQRDARIGTSPASPRRLRR